MTLDGTNTWVLAEPGSHAVRRGRPGAAGRAAPGGGARARRLPRAAGGADAADPRPRRPRRVGGPVRGADRRPGARARARGEGDLTDGDLVTVGGLELTVVATPGHTGDSLSFLLPADGTLLTGDTVLGRGTTVVAWPDGELAAYLLTGAAGADGRPASGEHHPAGARADAARRGGRGRGTTCSTAASGWSRCGPAVPGRGRTPTRWCSGSTRTSHARSGRPPGSASWPSSSTCAAATPEGRPAARRTGAAVSGRGA